MRNLSTLTMARTKKGEGGRLKSFVPGYLIAMALVLAVGACSGNPYEKFYTGYPTENSGSIGFVAYTGKPNVTASSGDPNRDIAIMFEDGYWILGSSSRTLAVSIR